MSKKNFIKKLVYNSLNEQLDYKEEVTKDEFTDALLDLSTLDLEDDQVRYPKINHENKSYLFGGNKYDLYILERSDLPTSGAFEIIIENNDEEVIGFIRGNKNKNTISFNLIHIKEEHRGQGIGTDIYEKFLNDGYIIISNKEITSDTYSMYDRLFLYGYKPLIYNDGRDGLMK